MVIAPHSLDMCAYRFEDRWEESGSRDFNNRISRISAPRRTGRTTGDYLHRWRLHSLAEAEERIIRLSILRTKLARRKEGPRFLSGGARSNIDAIRKPRRRRHATSKADEKLICKQTNSTQLVARGTVTSISTF